MDQSTTGLVSETKISDKEKKVVCDLSSAQDLHEKQVETQEAWKNQQIPIE
jgi:hypothetical protein